MLTPHQEEARRGKITGSDMVVLMSGDAQRILNLYEIKVGLAQPDDLSRIWRVQRGIVMEPLIRHWYELTNNVLLTRVGEVVTSPQHPWAAATLDGFDPNLNCPFEAKSTGGFEAIDIVINRYQPQIQWQMLVSETTQNALSVAMGDREPVVTYIPHAPDYIEIMLERADYFQQCVSLRRPPVQLDPVQPPIEAHLVLDMAGNEKWQRFAGVWLQTRAAAESYEEAKASLKALMPEEAKICFGHGVRITRDRGGRLHLRAVADD